MKSKGRRGPRGSGKFSAPFTTGDTSALHAQAHMHKTSIARIGKNVCMDWASPKCRRNHNHSGCNHNRQMIACATADSTHTELFGLLMQWSVLLGTYTANSCCADKCVRGVC